MNDKDKTTKQMIVNSGHGLGDLSPKKEPRYHVSKIKQKNSPFSARRG